jgi:hypothetical protein
LSIILGDETMKKFIRKVLEIKYETAINLLKLNKNELNLKHSNNLKYYLELEESNLVIVKETKVTLTKNLFFLKNFCDLLKSGSIIKMYIGTKGKNKYIISKNNFGEFMSLCLETNEIKAELNLENYDLELLFYPERDLITMEISYAKDKIKSCNNKYKKINILDIVELKEECYKIIVFKYNNAVYEYRETASNEWIDKKGVIFNG